MNKHDTVIGYEKWEAEQQAKRDARQAEIDYAEKTIADFCEREGLGEPDFSNLMTFFGGVVIYFAKDILDMIL